MFASTADAAVTKNYADMMQWVQANPQFKPEAKTEFAQVADGWLCAFAKASARGVVVTHEELSPDSKKRVPLPNVCQQFGVNYVDPFTMLKELKVKFQWST